MESTIPQHIRRSTLLRKNIVGSAKNYSLFDQYVNRGKVLKNFNIDPDKYKEISDPEIKKEWIIQQGNSYNILINLAEAHLQEQLQQFNDQINKKHKLMSKMSLIENEPDNRSDQYPWLDIKAPHKPNLEWRLKNELMQKL